MKFAVWTKLGDIAKRKDSLARLAWGGQVGRCFCEGLLEGKVDPFLGLPCSISLPNMELFCNMLLTVGSGQIWGNNQKHGFSTLSRKPECGSAQTDPEAAAPSGVGCWKVSHEEASLGTAGHPLLGPPELILLPYQTASRAVPRLEEKSNPNLPLIGSTLK